jgi:MSHA pilin protein MshD
MRTDKTRQSGLTLIELVLFIVIVGIAVAGILGVMSLTTKNSADPLRRKQALMIAEGLLEEVEAAKFSFCDPTADNPTTATSAADCTVKEEFGQESTSGRPYDNINDYVDKANEAQPAFDVGGILSDANLRAIDVQGYSATLTIRPSTLGPSASPIGSTGTSADTDVLRITVVVTYDNGQRVVLDGYRTRYAPQVL